MLQQEESQREVLSIIPSDMWAMYSRGPSNRQHFSCSACGGKGHIAEKCWSVIGYPKWHHKHKRQGTSESPKPTGQHSGSKWSHSKNHTVKMAAAAHGLNVTDSGNVVFTPQQLENLMKLLPSASSSVQSKPSLHSETDDELDLHFSGMASCHHAKGGNTDWIIDFGASDHMTFQLQKMTDTIVTPSHLTINLPTGDTAPITHIGKVILQSGLSLNNVLCVLAFQNNLLSVQKLVTDNDCEIQFFPSYCVIVDKSHKAVKG
ncbi:hypothetical protein SOVF_178910, partial [Spinacia oleracea]